MRPSLPRSKALTTLILVAAHLAFSPARANGPLTVGDVTAMPGTKVTGQISIPAAGDGVSTHIPVTVINGGREGPVLGLIAGVHGAEYAPIMALQSVVGQVGADNMRGAVIIVHIANLPAFTGRTIYFGPDDRKNLNRSFPGTADGTVTERIAHALTQQVIKQSDYLIDIHAGDANESLRPSYSAYYREGGGERVIAESRRLAVAFGLDTVVQFAGRLQEPRSVIYTSAQAVSLGIPAIDIESGELGSTEDRFVEPIVRGVFSVMRELGIVPGNPSPTESPLFISDRSRIYSDHVGVWYPSPLVKTGDYVSEGTRLGHISDYHGNRIADVNAPASGVLLILFGTPPVNEGDPLGVIGKVTND